PEDFYLDPSSYSAVNHTSFTSTTEVWIDATGTNNWSYVTSGIWTSGKQYFAKSRSVDRAGNIQTVGSTGNGNGFIVTLPASQLQVIVTTTTAIVAGSGRDITVKALDNGANVAITFTGAINFSIDAGGPESPGAGIPANYTF